MFTFHYTRTIWLCLSNLLKKLIPHRSRHGNGIGFIIAGGAPRPGRSCFFLVYISPTKRAIVGKRGAWQGKHFPAIGAPPENGACNCNESNDNEHNLIKKLIGIKWIYNKHQQRAGQTTSYSQKPFFGGQLHLKPPRYLIKFSLQILDG